MFKDKLSKLVKKQLNIAEIKTEADYDRCCIMARAQIDKIYNDSQICTALNLLKRKNYIKHRLDIENSYWGSAFIGIITGLITYFITNEATLELLGILVGAMRQIRDHFPQIITWPTDKILELISLVGTLLGAYFGITVLIIVLMALPVKFISLSSLNEYFKEDKYGTLEYELDIINNKLNAIRSKNKDQYVERKVGKITVRFSGEPEDLIRIQHFIDDLKLVDSDLEPKKESSAAGG